MNERIQQLAEQAGFRSNPDIYDRNQSFDISKFARSIIEECMGHVTWVGKTNKWPIEPFLTARAINKRIKQRFGIQETEQ